jgi:colanic acid/amylovoran biosynthesis glycosyltransferase
MSNVCHFIRKSSQLRSSFINNQINHHLKYKPSVVFRLFRDIELDGGYAEFNKEIDSLDLSKGQSSFERILYAGPKILSGRQVQWCENFLSRNDLNIAHFHYGTDCGVFYPLVKTLKIPSLVSFYGYDISSFPKYALGYGTNYLKNRVFSNVNVVLAMSPDMKNDLIKAGCPEEKIIVHYYGTDGKKFYHKHDYSEKERVDIFTISNLCAKKGHIFQFKAIKKLIDSGISNFHFRIAGSGELEQELKKYVKENELSQYIIFLGPLKYGSTEMLQEFKNADIFLHPSVTAPNGDKEGIPGTIIEAMSSGLPVISTLHAGIPYVIENNKTGILVEEWDIDTLAMALKRLIESRDEREKLGMAAQSYSLNNLDLHAKEKELEEIYDSLIS